MIAPLLLGALAGTYAGPAHAGNGTERGGGHYIIRPDGSYDLADEALIRFGERTRLSKALIVELDRASRLFALLGADRDPRYPGEAYSGFFGEFIFNDEDHVEYRFTDQIPPTCQPHANGYEGAAGLVGCTEGPVTWLLKDVFEKMSPRAQAKTIIHERIHARPHGAPEDYIADLTSGIDLALTLQDAENHGERPTLSPAQIEQLRTFVRRLAAMKFGSRYLHYRVTSHGGLVSAQSQVDASSYVGIGSVFNGSAGPNTVVLDSTCDMPLACTLYAGASLAQAWIGVGNPGARPVRVELGERASVVRSVIGLRDEGKTTFVQMLPGARIRDARLLNFAGLSLGAESEISDTWLQGLAYDADDLRPRLLLYPGAAIKNVGATTLRGKARNGSYGFGRQLLPTLKIKRGVTVDHHGEPLCVAPQYQYVSGSNLIRWSDETANYCKK